MDTTLVTALVGVIGALVGIFGAIIGVYFHTDKRLEEMRKETNVILNSIQQEMKEFHGKLCAIEERRRIEILRE